MKSSKRVALSILAVSYLSSAVFAQSVITTIGPQFAGPQGVAVDASGTVYVSDSELNVVYRLTSSGTATPVAGTGTAGFSGDGGTAASATLRFPQGLAVDASGNVYIADTNNSRIRRLSGDGRITTVAGGGNPSDGLGDNGPATSARLNRPYAVQLDGSGNLYIADTSNHRIRKVDTRGIITTVAGRGVQGFSGDDGPATLASLHTPYDLALDAAGTLFIADTFNHRIRRVSNGTIRTFAGSALTSYAGDGGPAANAGLHYPSGVAIGAGGQVLISDTFSHRVRGVDEANVITTLVGTGVSGFAGDGGSPLQARLSRPTGLKWSASGILYIVDSENKRVRQIRSGQPPDNLPTNTGTPTITALSSAFLGRSGVTGNSFLEIYGSNLSRATRSWSSADFRSQTAPTTLDGVSVTINGKPAFVQYISPGQVNVVVPDDTATGAVPVVVTNGGVASNTVQVTRARVAPALLSSSRFLVNGRQYAMALSPDFRSWIGRANLVEGLPFVTARSGDTIILYALGCGPTDPVTPAGTVASQNVPLALQYEVRIGGRRATVSFGGMLANTVGLYQFNVVIPNLAEGDHPIEIVVDGVRDGQNLYLSVGAGGASQPPPGPGPTPGPGTANFTALNGDVRLTIPTGWRVADQNAERAMFVPVNNTSPQIQQIAARWTRVETRCNTKIANEQLVNDVWREVGFLWTHTTAPVNEEFPAGPQTTQALRSPSGSGQATISTFCRDTYKIEFVMISDPLSEQTVSARVSLLRSLSFGGPPSLTGSWEGVPSGNNLTFLPNGVVDSLIINDQNMSSSCTGTYQTFNRGDVPERVVFWFPSSCNPQPAVQGDCSVSLDHVRAVFHCGATRAEFKRE